MENYPFGKYIQNLSLALDSIEKNKIELLENEIFNRMQDNSKIFIMGNGGSAANASHICGDYTKTFCLLKQNINIICPTDNISFYTAAVNDLDQEQVFSILLENIIGKDDLIIYLSGSGNSLNLVKCALKAKILGIKQASITAYKGGKLKDLVTIPIHVKISDMEIAEDCQIAIFHFIKQQIYRKIKNSNLKLEEIDSFNRYHKRVGGNEIA